MTRSDKWRKRPVVVRYFAYCDRLRELGSGREVSPVLVLRFYISMPRTWSIKKKAEMEGRPHQQRPDIDNLIKAFLDALCEEDSYVYDVHATKYWSVLPGIEVEGWT